jgi:tRNA1Val (adenine37-N6)-methyltransferase
LSNDYFEFKQFTVWQSSCAQKVSTDACIFGAWTARHARPSGSALDIGAGTGLLMLMVAQLHDVEIDGVEIEPDCFGQLRDNISKSKWADRLHAISGDVKEMDAPARYDLVMSNPPFYEKQLNSPNEVRNLAWHSSRLSLEDLISVAAGMLTPAGEFSLIVPYSRKDELLGLALSSRLFPRRSLSVRHTFDHPFARYMVMYSKKEGDSVNEILDIKTEEGNYSENMLQLMGEYYLFL